MHLACPQVMRKIVAGDLFDEELDMGLEADDKAKGDKEPTEDTGHKSLINLRRGQVVERNHQNPHWRPAIHCTQVRQQVGLDPPQWWLRTHQTRLLKIWMQAEAPRPRKKVSDAHQGIASKPVE